MMAAAAAATRVGFVTPLPCGARRWAPPPARLWRTAAAAPLRRRSTPRRRCTPVAVSTVRVNPPRRAADASSPPPSAVGAGSPADFPSGLRQADGAAAAAASADVADDAPAVAAAAAHPTRAPPGLTVAYLWPRVLLLGVAAVWGTNFGTVKLVQAAVPASAAAGLRFGLAAAALAPALVAARSRLSPGLWRDGLVAGLWVFAGYATQSVALEGTAANTSAFLCSLAVAFVPLLTRLFPSLRPANSTETTSPSTWMAALLAIGGVALLELGAGSPPALSDAFALFQAVAFGMGFILNERALAKYPDAALPISAIQLLVVGALSITWALTDGASYTAAGGLHVALPDVSPVVADATLGAAVAYAGLITTAATVVAENVALVRVSAAEMAVLLATEPLWAAAFSAAVLGESMGPTAAGGGGLILAACLTSTLLKGVGAKRKEG